MEIKQEQSKKRFQLNWISQYRDELFGIAILTVLFLHFTMLHLPYYKGSQNMSYRIIRLLRRYLTSSGVDIFVFLSGMGLYYSFSKNENIRSFYARRLRRVLIPYILVGGIFWIHVDCFTQNIGFRRALADFFYVTFFTEGVNNLWFVGFICVMYLLFPAEYHLIYKAKRGRLWFVLTMAASVLLAVCMSRFTPALFKNTNIAVTRIPVFFLGIYAGRSIKENRTIPHAAAAGFILLGFLARYCVVHYHIKGYVNRYATSIFGLAVMMLCIYVLRLLHSVRPVRAILRFFGRYSLEFYLLHILLWQLMGEKGWPLHEKKGYLIMVCICAVLAVLLGWVEKAILSLHCHNSVTEK